MMLMIVGYKVHVRNSPGNIIEEERNMDWEEQKEFQSAKCSCHFQLRNCVLWTLRGGAFARHKFGPTPHMKVLAWGSFHWATICGEKFLDVVKVRKKSCSHSFIIRHFSFRSLLLFFIFIFILMKYLRFRIVKWNKVKLLFYSYLRISKRGDHGPYVDQYQLPS